jgi:hypothetical protein
MFIFRLSIPGTLFDCTLESKLLRVRYSRRGNLSNCARLPGNISRILDYMTPKWGLMKSAGSLASESIGMRVLWR